MGRIRKNQAEALDRIGEPIELEKCPVCMEHTDCFSCLDGRCTALKECEGAACVFYKPRETAIKENEQIYGKLRKKGRSDLIRKNDRLFAALGIFGKEIKKAGKVSESLISYSKTDYLKAVAEATRKERGNGDTSGSSQSLPK